MSAIVRKNWERGWVPSGNFLNGPINGLARMDNLQLDEEGALSLIPGISDIYDFSSWPHTLYSKYFGNTKFRYTINNNGDITRNGSVLRTGADSARGAFDVAKGFVLIASGGVKIKDDTLNTFNLGIVTPDGPPGIEVASQPVTYLTALGVSSTANTDASNIATATPTLTVTDATVAGSPSPLAEDGVMMNVRIGDTSKLIKVRLQFNLDASSGETDFYFYEWENVANGPFQGGINAWTNLVVNRNEFTRFGSSTNDWTTLNSVKVQFFFTDSVTDNLVNEIRVLGGVGGPLNDTYDYTQIYVTADGKYLGKSSESPVTGGVWVSHGYTTISPHTSNITDDVDQIWIYRRSARGESVNRPWESHRQLDKWYRVAVISAPFVDTEDRMSDETALQQESLKPGMLSVQNLNEDIIGIVGDFNGRTLYLTPNNVYLSEIDNPDLIDPVLTFRVCGDDTTTALWIKVVDTGRVLVGTTVDILEITGTLVDFPTGEIDAVIRRLGIAHPPLTREAAVYQNNLFYYSSQGIVELAGANSHVISNDLNALFDGKICYGIAPIRVLGNSSQTAPICISKNKLFTALELQDGTRWCFVYDILKKYWFPHYTDPQSFFVEEDGRILAGYNLPAPALRELYDYTSTRPRNVHFQTFNDDDNLPRNRKDVFTLKVSADTGGLPVSVSVAKNGSEQYYTVMSGVTFTGREEKFVTIAETIGLGKSFSVKITGENLLTFKLYHFSIEYEARPEQLTYLRLNYSNLGTPARKRFVNFPFEIDTLGNTCEFIPVIDGTIYPTSTFTFSRKGTHIHYFDTEAVGTDISGIICGFFEFYGPRYDEMVSEKMPNPVTYLRIPQTDYGTPNRKRHSSYKFRINTRGQQVRFTPRLDGVNFTPLDFSTSEVQVVEYFFTSAIDPDPIAINIGGVLESLTSPKSPFEFYGEIKPQEIEVLPPRLKEFTIPATNYGHASKKRIRVIPMELNSNGSPVTFTPYLDGVAGTSSTLTTSSRGTVYHFFSTDVFATDISGRLESDQPFEFYGLMKPEVVEVLPVPKMFDQLGPIRYDKLAKWQALRLRVITQEIDLPVKILIEEEETIPNMIGAVPEWYGIIKTKPNRDDVYEIPLPKTVNGTIFRVEIGPVSNPFYRYDLQVKLVVSGMDANPKWVKIT